MGSISKYSKASVHKQVVSIIRCIKLLTICMSVGNGGQGGVSANYACIYNTTLLGTFTAVYSLGVDLLALALDLDIEYYALISN